MNLMDKCNILVIFLCYSTWMRFWKECGVHSQLERIKILNQIYFRPFILRPLKIETQDSIVWKVGINPFPKRKRLWRKIFINMDLYFNSFISVLFLHFIHERFRIKHFGSHEFLNLLKNFKKDMKCVWGLFNENQTDWEWFHSKGLVE